MAGCRSSSLSRARASALLVLLLGSVLSSGVDLVEDHPAPNRAGGHSESESRSSHLVQHHGDKAAPCNVCFLKSLLGQALRAAQEIPALADGSIRPVSEILVSTARAEFNSDVNRGPPLTS
jgi:hypothetical protein